MCFAKKVSFVGEKTVVNFYNLFNTDTRPCRKEFSLGEKNLEFKGSEDETIMFQRMFRVPR